MHADMPPCKVQRAHRTHWIMVDVVVEGGGRREEGMVIEGWDG